MSAEDIQNAADNGFEAYRTSALAEGFDEVQERQWPPNAELADHTHDFALKARVIQGEMWLSHDGQTRHLRPGDEFALERNHPHAERYGPQGAAYWVARKY